MAPNDAHNADSVLGRMVVEQGLATQAEIDTCVRLQRGQSGESDASQRSLADVLVEHEVVTHRQIERLRPQVEEQRAGRQIPGYEVTRQLGAGAMAKVYLAHQLSLDRPVAIKVLPKKHTKNSRFVERFYAEGKAAAKLNHPNIVGALDVGRVGDTHYFVMEYVDGKTVYDEITRHKRYPESEALNIAVQIARALAHAHAAGFIHRDVKPKNIMITPDGVAKLADMGLARPVDDAEAAEAEKGKAYGTPYYISPEQIRGDTDVDCRADIYSLGATFFHMVTGHVPFDGPNPSAVMHKHLKETLVPPDHINSSLSAGISEIIEVCMAKDREKRYSSADQLLEDLEAILRGEPPAQARRRFDLGSLMDLEKSAVQADPATMAPQPPLTTSPLFWLAVAGWAVAMILLAAVILNGR